MHIVRGCAIIPAYICSRVQGFVAGARAVQPYISQTSLLVLRLNHADVETVLKRILLLGVSAKSWTEHKTISVDA